MTKMAAAIAIRTIPVRSTTPYATLYRCHLEYGLPAAFAVYLSERVEN